MEWEKILSDAVQNGTIRELYLSKIPTLRTTTNWKKVELIGSIDHEMKHSHYRGGLIRLDGSIYFVRNSTINALSHYMSWNFPRKIQVIKEKKNA